MYPGALATVIPLHFYCSRRRGDARGSKAPPAGLVRSSRAITNRCVLFGLLISGILLLGIPTLSPAQDTGVPWTNLNPEEQRVLQRYSDQWDTLSPDQQERLQRGAKEWIHMNPQQQERIRSRYDRFRQLPPEEQERLRRTHRWYRNLPPDQREDLRRRWKNSPSRQRPGHR